jgi:hypothetical protein
MADDIETVSIDDSMHVMDKLESNGKNWVIFQGHFTTMVEQTYGFEQFDRSNPKPTLGSGAPTDAESKAHAKLVMAWQQKENLVLYLLTQKLPSTVFAKYS